MHGFLKYSGSPLLFNLHFLHWRWVKVLFQGYPAVEVILFQWH